MAHKKSRIPRILKSIASFLVRWIGRAAAAASVALFLLYWVFEFEQFFQTAWWSDIYYGSIIAGVCVLPVASIHWYVQWRRWAQTRMKIALTYLAFFLALPILFAQSYSTAYGLVLGYYRADMWVVDANFPAAFILLYILSMFIVVAIFAALVQLIRYRTKQHGLYFLFQIVVGPALVATVLYGMLVPLHKYLRTSFFTTTFSPLYVERDRLWQDKTLYLSDNLRDVLPCYQQTNFSLPVLALDIFFGDSLLFSPDMGALYVGRDCVAVLIPPNAEKTSTSELVEMAKAAEVSIRMVHGARIAAHWDLETSELVDFSQLEETTSNSMAYYDKNKRRIGLTVNLDFLFETLIHEQLHAFSSPELRPIAGYSRSGLEEGMTQYATMAVMQQIPVPFKNQIYPEQVRALEALLEYVEVEKVYDAYFNTEWKELIEPVDAATYPGAFCAFNYFIDRSVIETIDENNATLAAQYADDAIAALKAPADVPEWIEYFCRE